jgi:hypothetical protein
VAALKVDCPGGYLHVVDGNGGKQRTSILPKPVLEALEAHLQGRAGGCLSPVVGTDLEVYSRGS